MTAGPRSPRHHAAGFTLVELMIVVVVIGILAAVALPSFMQLKERANEAGTKSNMHTVQLHAEDYGVQFDGVFPPIMDGAHIANMLPGGFANPYDGSVGAGAAWENREVFAGLPSAVTGIVSYADSGTMTYNVKGQARDAPLTLVLVSAQ